MESRKIAKEKEWGEAVQGVQNGEKTARNRMVEENIGLIRMVLKRFGGRGYDMEELFQVGAVGLMKAADRFDPELGYHFSTYAVPVIIGEIKRFLRDDGLIHISRKIKGDTKVVASVSEQIRMEENREPTFKELEERTGLGKEEIFLAIESCYEVESLSGPMPESAGAAEGQQPILQERIADEYFSQKRMLDHLLLKQVMERLDKEEQILIWQRHILGKTQAETAREMDMNQVAVSRKEKKTLQKLRLYLEEK